MNPCHATELPRSISLLGSHDGPCKIDGIPFDPGPLFDRHHPETREFAEGFRLGVIFAHLVLTLARLRKRFAVRVPTRLAARVAMAAEILGRTATFEADESRCERATIGVEIERMPTFASSSTPTRGGSKNRGLPPSQDDVRIARYPTRLPGAVGRCLAHRTAKGFDDSPQVPSIYFELTEGPVTRVPFTALLRLEDAETLARRILAEVERSRFDIASQHPTIMCG